MSRSALHSGQIIFRGSKSGPTKSRTPKTPSVLAGTLGYCSRRIQLRNAGCLSLDECAGENQLCARRARIREAAPCTKESLFDDGAKDSITDRRVRSRMTRALEFHGHYLAPAPGAMMSTIPQNADIPFPALGSSFCAMRLHPATAGPPRDTKWSAQKPPAHRYSIRRHDSCPQARIAFREIEIPGPLKPTQLLR